MKKLFFLCAFLFVSIEMQAQLYIVHTYLESIIDEETGLPNGEYLAYMTTSSPDGTVSTVPLPFFSTISLAYYSSPEEIEERVQIINEELNNIISQGYKLIHATTETTSVGFTFQTYYLAVPWTTVGLTEIDSLELDFRISPNPAKEYINVEVDFKSQPSELVLISERGYIYFKKDISNILSGHEFTVDISSVSAGKYLVTVKDDKQYLTPKKLIVL